MMVSIVPPLSENHLTSSGLCFLGLLSHWLEAVHSGHHCGGDVVFLLCSTSLCSQCLHLMGASQPESVCSAMASAHTLVYLDC